MSKDQIWIELEAPCDAAHAAVICATATRMMNRLGDTRGKTFSWSERDACYCWGDPMGYVMLPDRGCWFNLDYLGREEKS